MLLEVIVQTVEDARAAAEGGADRLEVVREIERDGLTPAIDLVRAMQTETRLPLRVMVRERDDFDAGPPHDLAALQDVVRTLAGMRVDGIVLGFTRGAALDLETVDALLAVDPDLRVTFHRAFDALSDPVAAIAALRARRQIDRILTSGGDGGWPERIDTLRRYASAAAPDLTILAGGGVDEAAVDLLSASGCVAEVHVGRAARVDSRRTGPVSAERVRHLKAITARRPAR